MPDDFNIVIGSTEEYAWIIAQDSVEEFAMAIVVEEAEYSLVIDFTTIIPMIHIQGNENEVVIIGPDNQPRSSGILITDIGGSTELEVTAGEILNGQAVVIQNLLGCFIFDPTDETHYGKVIGFTKTSALSGDIVKVLPIGEVVQVGWGLTPGDLYYATAAGQITNIPPTHKIMQPIGVAKDSDTLIIHIHQATVTI